MNAVAALSDYAPQIALTLLHFLWQGLAVAVVALICAFVLRNGPSRRRYALWLTALSIMAACPVVTFAYVSTHLTVFESTSYANAATPFEPGANCTAPAALDLPHLTSPFTDDESPPSALHAALPSFADAPPRLPSPATSTGLPKDESGLSVSGKVETSQISASPADEIPAVSPPAASTPAWTLGDTPAPVEPAFSPAWLSRLRNYDWRLIAHWVCVAYLAGVLAFMLRLAAGLYGGHRLRRAAAPITDTALTQSLGRRAHQLGLRRVPRVFECTRTAIPTVVGLVRPIVLLPAAVMTGMTPAQLDLLLLHELAHIRRYDPLLNVAQRVIEALLFFHPAVWFVSRRVRIEREHCCDDLVIALTGRAVPYAETLLRAAELGTGRAVPSTAVAAGTPSQLRRRVHRLLGASPPAVKLTRLGLASVLAVLAVAAAGLTAFAVSSGQQPPPLEGSATATAGTTPAEVPETEAGTTTDEETEPSDATASNATETPAPQDADRDVESQESLVQSVESLVEELWQHIDSLRQSDNNDNRNISGQLDRSRMLIALAEEKIEELNLSSTDRPPFLRTKSITAKLQLRAVIAMLQSKVIQLEQQLKLSDPAQEIVVAQRPESEAVTNEDEAATAEEPVPSPSIEHKLEQLIESVRNLDRDQQAAYFNSFLRQLRSRIDLMTTKNDLGSLQLHEQRELAGLYELQSAIELHVLALQVRPPIDPKSWHEGQVSAEARAILDRIEESAVRLRHGTSDHPEAESRAAGRFNAACGAARRVANASPRR